MFGMFCHGENRAVTSQVTQKGRAIDPMHPKPLKHSAAKRGEN